MKTTKMNVLLKEYGLTGDMDYFEVIINSLVNGKRYQSEKQFKAMEKKNRISFLQCLVGGNWQHGLKSADIVWYIGLM